MPVNCNHCDKVYKHREALAKHIRQKHNEKTTKLLYRCSHCSEDFNNKRDIITHLKTHRENSRKNRLMCPLCPDLNKNYNTLRKHLEDSHQYTIERKELEFNNMREFERWKMKIEDEYQSMYVQNTAEKQLKNKSRIYYSCHRSYAPRVVDNYKRNSKASGSNKFGRACPSSLIVTKYEDKISVSFYSTHIGHTCEMERMRLNAEDRRIIADKMADGVPMQQILEDVRQTASSTNFHRIHLLNKKDLHNIKRDFSIGYPVKNQDEDAMDYDDPDDHDYQTTTEENDATDTIDNEDEYDHNREMDCYSVGKHDNDSVVIIDDDDGDDISQSFQTDITEDHHIEDEQFSDASALSDLEDQEIQSKLELLLGLSEKVNLEAETRSRIIRNLDNVISLMYENIQLKKSGISVNKHVERQLKQYPAKKEQIVDHEQLELSATDSKILGDYLSLPDSTILIIHSD